MVSADNRNGSGSNLSEEDCRRHFMALSKHLEEAEIFLSASRSYVSASTTYLTMMKRYMCIAEADSQSAAESINELEKKLQTMHLELHSLYQNFCKDSGHDHRPDERERTDAQESVHRLAVNLLEMCASTTSIDINDTMKCDGSTMMLPNDMQPLSNQLNQERDTSYDWLFNQTVIFENNFRIRQVTDDTDHRNCTGFRDFESTYKEHENLEPQNSFRVSSMGRNDCGSRSMLDETEIRHVNGLVNEFQGRPSQTAEGDFSANFRTNAALFSDYFNGRRSSTANLIEKPEIPGGNSCLAAGFPVVDNTRISSKLNGWSSGDLMGFLKLPVAKEPDLNNMSRKYNGQNGDILVKRNSIYEAEERKTVNDDPANMRINETNMPERGFLGAISHNSFPTRRKEAELNEIRIQSTRGEAESSMVFVNRYVIEPDNKAVVFPSSLVNSSRTCKVGCRNDLSANPEAHSKQSAELSSTRDQIFTLPKVLKQTIGGYMNNLLRESEIERSERESKYDNVPTNTPFSSDVSLESTKILEHDLDINKDPELLFNKVLDNTCENPASLGSSVEVVCNMNRLHPSRKNPIPRVNHTQPFIKQEQQYSSQQKEISNNWLVNFAEMKDPCTRNSDVNLTPGEENSISSANAYSHSVSEAQLLLDLPTAIEMYKKIFNTESTDTGTSGMFGELDSGTELENVTNLKNNFFYETIRKEPPPGVLSTCSDSLQTTNYSRLPSSEKSSTSDLTNTSLSPIYSQSEGPSNENSSSVNPSLTNAGMSLENNLEDSQESCFDISTTSASPVRKSSTPISSSDNGSPSNMM